MDLPSRTDCGIWMADDAFKPGFCRMAGMLFTL